MLKQIKMFILLPITMAFLAAVGIFAVKRIAFWNFETPSHSEIKILLFIFRGAALFFLICAIKGRKELSEIMDKQS